SARDRARHSDLPAQDARGSRPSHARDNPASDRQGRVSRVMARAAKIPKDPALDALSAAKIAAFASVLRANGFAVGLAESRDALAVVASPAGRRPALLKPALRALFSATREEWR